MFRWQTRTAFVAVALACAGACAAQMDMGTPPSLGDIRFAADVVVTPAVDGTGRVSVTYRVTYDALVFLRRGDGYAARYEVTAILYGRDGEQVAGDSWQRRVEAASYAETNARSSAMGETLVLEAPPGVYRLRVSLRSVDTGAEGVVEREVSVGEYVPGLLTLGTLEFGRARSDSSEFEAAPSRDYGEEWPAMRVGVPVYGDPGRSYRMEVALETERGVVEAAFADTVHQTALVTTHEARFSVLNLEVGAHFIRVRVHPLGGGRDVTARARFRVLTSPRSWGSDFEKMLQQVGYFASREEVGKLREAAPEDREAAWEEFWRGRDPDPSTGENEFRAEFLRRLGYANMKFTSTVEGWRTDMGRVYIVHGEPDDVESQPVDRMLHSWEVWYYYRDHVKFTFVDTEGFGEFSLVETSRI
jgi:GWxTD domain-containing protein